MVSGHLWGQADLFAPELPAFVDWGWEEVLDLEDPNALILPTWSIMFDISGAYEKLSRDKIKKSLQGGSCFTALQIIEINN